MRSASLSSPRRPIFFHPSQVEIRSWGAGLRGGAAAGSSALNQCPKVGHRIYVLSRRKGDAPRRVRNRFQAKKAFTTREARKVARPRRLRCGRGVEGRGRGGRPLRRHGGPAAEEDAHPEAGPAGEAPGDCHHHKEGLGGYSEEEQGQDARRHVPRGEFIDLGTTCRTRPARLGSSLAAASAGARTPPKLTLPVGVAAVSFSVFFFCLGQLQTTQTGEKHARPAHVSPVRAHFRGA